MTNRFRHFSENLRGGPDQESKTSAENLGRYKSGRPEPRFFLARTAIVLQQATRRFAECSMCRQRVVDRWQRRQLACGHHIPGRILCLLETVPLNGRPEPILQRLEAANRAAEVIGRQPTSQRWLRDPAVAVVSLWFLSFILENDRFREVRYQALPDFQVEGLTFLKKHS